jgi:hypothetical protein
MNDDVIEQLAMLLGSDKADEVTAFFSGGKRHALIRAEYRVGASYQELALRNKEVSLQIERASFCR